MATTLQAAICPYRSETASLAPLAANMEIGEIAINLTDQKIYSKTAAGVVVQIGGVPASGGSLPSFAGNDGKYLSLSGGALVWSTVAIPALNDLLPTQAGNAGKVLKTDGANASWTARLPDQTTPAKTGYFLRSAGTADSEYWDNYNPLQPASITLQTTQTIGVAASTMTAASIYAPCAVKLGDYDLIVVPTSVTAAGARAYCYNRVTDTMADSDVLVRTLQFSLNKCVMRRIDATNALFVSCVGTALEAVVLTIDGAGLITVNTPATKTLAGTFSDFGTSVYMGSNTWVFSYRGNTSKAHALAMSVSGTTVTIGNEIASGAASTSKNTSLLDYGDGVHLMMPNGVSTGTFTWDCMSLSGTTLTLGTPWTLATDNDSTVWHSRRPSGGGIWTAMRNTGVPHIVYLTISANVVTGNNVSYGSSRSNTMVIAFDDFCYVVCNNTVSGSFVRIATESAGIPSLGTEVSIKYGGANCRNGFCVKRNNADSSLWLQGFSSIANDIAFACVVTRSGTSAIISNLRSVTRATADSPDPTGGEYTTYSPKTWPVLRHMLNGSQGTYYLPLYGEAAPVLSFNGTDLRLVVGYNDTISQTLEQESASFYDDGTKAAEDGWTNAVKWRAIIDQSGGSGDAQFEFIRIEAP